ncbi:MAG: Ig-like domain-containing protein, partial [Methylococcales bacterium]
DQYRFPPLSRKKYTLKLLQKDAEIHTLLAFAQSYSQNSQALPANFAAQLLGSKPGDLLDEQSITRFLMALGVALTDQDLAVVAKTAKTFNSHIETHENLRLLAQLRADAAKCISGGDFECLSICFTEARITAQLNAGGVQVCDRPLKSVSITQLLDDNGPYPNDFVTNNALSLNGTAQEGVWGVVVNQRENPISQTLPVINGEWSFNFAAPLDEGVFTFSVIGKNAAGHAVTAPSEKTVKVDKIVPAIPENNGGGVNETALPGLVPGDTQEFWKMPPGDDVFPVRFEVREVVETPPFSGNFVETGPFLGPYAALISASGNVQMNVMDRLNPGPAGLQAFYNVKFFISDAAGNESCTASIDTGDPRCRSASSNALLTVNSSGDNLSIAPTSRIFDTTPELTGVWSGGDPAGLSVTVNGKTYRNEIIAQPVDFGSTWSLTIPDADALPPGLYDITARYDYVNKIDTVTSAEDVSLRGTWNGENPDSLSVAVCHTSRNRCFGPYTVANSNFTINGTAWYLDINLHGEGGGEATTLFNVNVKYKQLDQEITETDSLTIYWNQAFKIDLRF